MTIKLDDIMAALAAQRSARIEGRVMELATLKVLRKAAEAPRKDLSAVLDVAPSVFSHVVEGQRDITIHQRTQQSGHHAIHCVLVVHERVHAAKQLLVGNCFDFNIGKCHRLQPSHPVRPIGRTGPELTAIQNTRKSKPRSESQKTAVSDNRSHHRQDAGHGSGFGDDGGLTHGDSARPFENTRNIG